MNHSRRKPDEKELLRRLQLGDEEAFTVIYGIYKDRIGYRLLRMLKSEALAEELLQDLFLKIWHNRYAIDPSKTFKAYLYRIAENMVYDLFRRASKEKELLARILSANAEFYTHIEESLFEKEDHNILHEAISQLPARRKEIFIACKLEGKSYKQVAEELGISATTVNDHIQKASIFLKARVPSMLSVLLIWACH
ncbi:MAG TPA: RNA polymerase sigma-70 factor [Anseongella sp.]